jgi:hypothetical protein
MGANFDVKKVSKAERSLSLKSREKNKSKKKFITDRQTNGRKKRTPIPTQM